jgi:hypothetical protein
LTFDFVCLQQIIGNEVLCYIWNRKSNSSIAIFQKPLFLLVFITFQAFIKWAQWASTRPDIFPESLCSVLSTLQSQAPEHSFSFTKKQIRNELGAPIEEVFETFSVRPIASGSIAQVYKV